MEWPQTLEFGHKYEMKFISKMLLTSPSASIFRPEGAHKEYDVIIDDIQYEIKADTIGERTGNIAIEYEGNGVPSGIETTTSQFYVYYLIGAEEVCYLIPTQFIRDLITSTKPRSLNVGYKKLARVWLLKANLFSEFITV